MGLLKSLLGAAIKASSESTRRQAQDQTAPQPAAAHTAPAAAPQAVLRTPSDSWDDYFAGILSTGFPQYEVRRNVPVTDLAGYAEDSFQLYNTRPLQAYKAEWGAPYTFVLYDGGAPAGIVMLGGSHSHDSNVKYLIARMYAKKMGLPYINFYTHMENEREYVIRRIRKFMNI